MATQRPRIGLHYVIQTPSCIVDNGHRELAKCYDDEIFVTYSGRSVSIKDVVGYWILPPDGMPLGEVGK